MAFVRRVRGWAYRTRTAPAPPRRIAADIVTARRVLDAFATLGLELHDPRDTTANGIDIGCTRQVTTNVCTIREWPSVAAAKRWTDSARVVSPTVLAGGLVTIDWRTGGSTPDYERGAYERALARVALLSRSVLN